MPAGAASIPGSGAAGAAYAHSPGPDGRWQPLEEHLRRVAELAREFGEPFGAGDLAYVLGLWHDLGKVNPAFQRYLRAAAGGVRVDTVPHAIWGAAFAYRVLRAADASAELILPVLGHHAGLSNAGTVGQTLEAFLDEHPDLVPLVAGVVRSLPTVPKKLPPPRSSTRRELFLRMAFSCLVDADYLDTEGHFNPSQAERRGVPTAVEQLRDLLLANQQDLIARAASTSMPTVTRVRREVYESCLLAAAGPQGIYRLTVPTGGGKTRSGLAFALEHAVRHGLRRVVVALPYTSIIDQTAAECRRIFGDAAVLEHYSQAPIFESEAEDPTTARLRVATENWDATLIVTTTVQLFESLFTRRPGRARRLHRLARSVIILDEVQALPPHLLRPTLDVLRTLVEEYGVTVVLSTATQPAFAESRALDVFSGCQIHEIVPDYPTHFDLLRRVDFEVRPNPVPWEAVAAELRARDQVMVVLNTRRDATALLDQFDDAEEVCHLSSLLCGAHRRVVLARIRDRLAHGSPVRLVSTQVVEAGVDIDFPVVWRALGPLDRIIQAAGRCNREGRRERGLVIVFEPEAGGAPRGPYQAGLTLTRALLQAHGAASLHDPALGLEYFRRLYAIVDPDRAGIQRLRQALDYPAVDAAYRLIAEATAPVVVPYGEGPARLDAWRRAPGRRTWARLQPFVVSVSRHELDGFAADGLVTEVSPWLYRWLGAYDERRGLREAAYDPADLFV